MPHGSKILCLAQTKYDHNSCSKNPGLLQAVKFEYKPQDVNKECCCFMEQFNQIRQFYLIAKKFQGWANVQHFFCCMGHVCSSQGSIFACAFTSLLSHFGTIEARRLSFGVDLPRNRGSSWQPFVLFDGYWQLGKHVRISDQYGWRGWCRNTKWFVAAGINGT